VAIAVFPSTTYWIVLQSRWNTLRTLATLTPTLKRKFFKDESAVLAF